MVMVGSIYNALDFQQAALGLRAQRQQILAGNIANADTPNYKARDFDFSTALKEAVAGRSSGSLALDTTAPGHLSGTLAASPARLMYRTPAQPSADGNTVDMDVERAQFSENAVQYEAGLTFITNQIKLLLSATQA
jgi:flagellar basal-body rod protein FlgB